MGDDFAILGVMAGIGVLLLTLAHRIQLSPLTRQSGCRKPLSCNDLKPAPRWAMSSRILALF
jgi:hypothetical protein